MAAYVTTNEYVATFGAQETTRITNSSDSGSTATYDSAKVDAALEDSSEVVNGYAARRYVTPLSSTPLIVKGWTKALAREALYLNTGRMLDAVKDAADRVRAQLRDLALGNINLPVDQVGGTPPTLSIGLALTSNDRPTPVVGPALDAFTAPFTGESDVPRWRSTAGG